MKARDNMCNIKAVVNVPRKLVKNKLKRKNRGVKQAGFIVLHQTYMPSILIETGFITNKNDMNKTTILSLSTFVNGAFIASLSS